MLAQSVAFYTHNPRVVGSIPTDANCFMWVNILWQDVNVDCASPPRGKCGYLRIRDTGFCT